MKQTRTFILALGILLLILSPAWRQQQEKRDIQAVVVKVVNGVTKKTGTTTGWQKAIAADRLASGYQVKTDDGSAAIVRFVDQSTIIVRAKSVVMITGKVRGKEILDRDVYTDRGNVQFTVKKQESEEFKFSSPVSVASIRGTTGAYQSGDSTSDLIINEGLATFTNLFSNQSKDVGTGQTGHIYGQNFDVHNSTPNEHNNGSSTSDLSTGQGTGGQTTGQQGQGTTKQLIIYGQDANGQLKKIVIDIQQ